MGPSPTIARTGLRTAPRHAWRTAVGTAAAAVAGTPSLWLLGMLAFLCRGGLLILLLPVLALPSPVSLRLMVGANLGSAGFTSEFYVLVFGLALVATALALASLLVAVLAEIAAFERLVERRLDADDRRSLIGSLLTVQLLALSTLLAAAIPLVVGAVEITYAELVRPSLGAPLYERVLGQLGGPLYLLLAVLVLVEMASAVASRRLLVTAYGLPGSSRTPLRALLVGLGRPVLHPLATLGTAVLGWLTFLAVLLPAVWLIGVGWQAARSALLGAPLADTAELAGAALAVVLLCAAWLGAVFLCGLASALRAALWTSEELR